MFSVEDVLLYTLSYLPASDLLSSAAVCQSFNRGARSDVLWKPQCSSELGVSTLHELPPGGLRPIGISSPPQTYFHLFMTWSKSFKGYYREDVKAMYNWWTQLEEWCEANAPAVLATLNPPALESDIKAATQAYRSLLLNSEDNATFPYMLRLMYRFHNGQASLYDRHTPPADDEADRRRLLGLFGGTSFYDSEVCMRLLPLDEVVGVSSMVCNHLRGKSFSHSSPSHSHQDSMVADDDDFSPVPIESCVIFSKSVVELQKFYCLGLDEYEVGGRLRSGSVYVSNSRWSLTPCHPTTTPASSPSTSRPQYLQVWLTEYLRRLQEGIYAFQPCDLTHENMAGMPRNMAEEECMISLYPLKPLTEPLSSRPEEKLGASRCVTRNIEVVACPVFIPEKSSIPMQLFFWSYSVRLRILPSDHPDYDPRFNAQKCQLISRHWSIYEPHHPEHQQGHEETVNGEGVIGLYPLLGHNSCGDKSGEDMMWPFAYQSCATTSSFPGNFKGHMKFVPGTIEAPGGAPFSVELAEFPLSVPQFLY